MARIGRLNVEVGATNKTKGGLLLASKDISRWAKQTRKATMDVGSMAMKSFAKSGAAAAASLGAAGAAMGYFVAKTIDAVGDANDFAKSVGSSYTELRTLQKAASMAGVDLETTNGAMMKMSDVLGSAFGGNKAAIDSFKNIGVSVDSLRRMRPEQQFVAIAEAVNKIGDPAKKVAAARDIFGKSGGGLISFFKNARGDIEDAAKALDLYGVSLKQIDVEKIDAAGDAMGEFKFILEGVGNQLAKNFAPLITAASEDLVKMIEDAGGVGNAVDTAFRFGVTATGEFLDKVEDLELGWLKATKAVNDFYLALYEHDPNDPVEKARAKNNTERRLNQIPEKHRDQARKILEQQGGFVNESPNAAAFAEHQKMNEEFDKRVAEIADRKSKRGTIGERFKAWEQNAQMKGTADAAAALGDASEKRLDAEEKITKELKAQKGIQEAGQGALALTALGGLPVGTKAKGKAVTGAVAKAGSSEGEAFMPAREAKTFPGRAPGVFTTAAGVAAGKAKAGPGFGTKEFFDNVLGFPSGADPNAEPKWKSKIPSGDPKWMSKIPSGEPNWKSKIPSGNPNWMNKTVAGSSIGRADGGGSDMSETNGLLREVRDALRGGVKGVYA